MTDCLPHGIKDQSTAFTIESCKCMRTQILCDCLLCLSLAFLRTCELLKVTGSKRQILKSAVHNKGDEPLSNRSTSIAHIYTSSAQWCRMCSEGQILYLHFNHLFRRFYLKRLTNWELHGLRSVSRISVKTSLLHFFSFFLTERKLLDVN